MHKKSYDYKKKRVDEDMFWKAWDFCEKEFGNMWRDIDLDTKRELVLEKYERMCEAKKLEPYSQEERNSI